MSDHVISTDMVDDTINSFTQLDAAGDKRSMKKMGIRLRKEQPALLRYTAAVREEHGDVIGEACVFYGTLVWAMFQRKHGKFLSRLTDDNLTEAENIVDEAIAKIEGVKDLPIHERVAPELTERQPHIYAKLQELIEEDVREEAMTEHCAEVIYRPTQILVEAFDAATEGRRPGERQGPVVREQPKVGRNEPCPCGSGKKFKKCCGKAG